MSRLVKSVSQALGNVVKADDEVNWTGSMISLWWIRNTDKEYNQFVENPVSEIRRNAPPEQWRYCPTTENPAGIASRGIKATALKESSLWLHGPEFLSKESAYWPVQPVRVKEEFCELKSAKSTVSSLLNTVLLNFWKRWKKEYLTEVRVHHNCNSSNKKPTIKVGQLFVSTRTKRRDNFGVRESSNLSLEDEMVTTEELL